MRQALCAAALLTALTGCGTTVPYAGSTPTDSEKGLSSPSTTSADAHDHSGVTIGPSGQLLRGGGTLPSGSAQVTGTAQGGSGLGPKTTSPVGTKSSTISVGWVVLKSNAALAGSLGAGSLATPDQEQYAKVMIDWINAHGGLGGRTIKPVFFHPDPSTSETFAQVGSEACATFTQDNHVEVVVDPAFGTVGGTLASCLAKHGVVHVSTAGGAEDPKNTARLPTLLSLAGLSVNRLARLEVDALSDQGFFTPQSVVGLITYDQPLYHAAVEQVLKPRFKARTGLTLSDDRITYLPPINQTSDTGATSAAVSNAVLSYRSKGVDRVFWLQDASLSTLLFMRDADGQKYYPRYGLGSFDSPQTLTSFVTPASLHGAIGFGWRPVYDVVVSQQLQPGRPNCLKIFASKNFRFTPADASEAAALRHCEGGLMLAQAMTLSAGRVGLELVRAAENTSGNFKAATTLGLRLTTARHDGVDVYRNLAYGDACNCFTYTGAGRSIP